jgi:NADH-quinone oxidoreductase subunit N
LILNEQVIIDTLGYGLKTTAYCIAILVVLATNVNKNNNRSELILIELFALLGVSILCSASNLLIIYLGLETLALSLYGLVASNRKSVKSSEAAMKFFVLGSISSGLFLYGVSLIYGLYGSINVSDFSNLSIDNSIELQIAIGFLICGIIFKFGAFPFHSWVPDSYQGSTNSVALFISTVPKIGAFALLYRLLIESFYSLSFLWSSLLLVLGLSSIVFGNIVALSQNQIRRLFGYSAIGHIGFILIGISAINQTAIESSLMYLFIYIIMTLSAFISLELLSSDSKSIDTINDLKGLNNSHPWVALMLLFTMFSMIGIPPFIGFYAKWIILSTLIDSDMIYTATIAIIISVIAAYYYLKIVWYMYFEKSDIPLMKDTSSLLQKLILFIIGTSLLLLGLIPEILISMIDRLFHQIY